MSTNYTQNSMQSIHPPYVIRSTIAGVSVPSSFKPFVLPNG
ncbi:hypothetical protein [Commensalibacter sp. Nvir]